MADTVMTARVHDPDVLAVSFALTCFITFDLLSMPLPRPTCFYFSFTFLGTHTLPIST